MTYIIDIDKDGTYVGHGEIRFNISKPIEYFKNKPFEGSSVETNKFEFSKQEIIKS